MQSKQNQMPFHEIGYQFTGFAKFYYDQGWSIGEYEQE